MDLLRQQAEQEIDRANRRTEEATRRADAADLRADILAAKLRELGIDID